MKPDKTNGVKRSPTRSETVRAKGQFWTPEWTADFMVAYALRDKPGALFDPAVGEGAFFLAGKRCARAHGFNLALLGRDIDTEVVARAKGSGLSEEDLQGVEIRDFLQAPPQNSFPAIVANPPYVRHHRLPAETKARLREFAQTATGLKIDGRAGLHVYFLIRALLCLAPHGRLAFIVSADICEGVFSNALWRWVSTNYRLEYVISFAANATPFPDVDANPIVFLIRKESPTNDLVWVECFERDSEAITSIISGELPETPKKAKVFRRSLAEALETGLSRPPVGKAPSKFVLGDFARVMRGIVTGDNAFFFLTSLRAKELRIPEDLLLKAVGRTRDVQGTDFDDEDIERLESKGRPTRVLNVNGMPLEELPPAVRSYLDEGEKRGLPNKTLIKSRKPWYRMETRQVPPIMFAYLGRRNARFIRNRAGVVPLTSLLCVYPRNPSPESVEGLWRVLSNPETIANLRRVGKSYGGDAVKVEPRALERLPLPDELVCKERLNHQVPPRQTDLAFKE